MKILFIIGTRPEAIKLAPLILKSSSFAEVEVCSTGQHKELLDQVLTFFGITPHYELKLMKPDQSLEELTSSIILETSRIYEISKPHLVVVQGDTTTAMASALSAFYKKIKVAHVEAGLRSHEKYSPFPEEMNRSVISKIASFHFCPTQKAFQNLISEGVSENVHEVGNTVIDALILASELVKLEKETNKTVIVTMHRRENFGKPAEEICDAISTLSDSYPDIEFVFLVHPNPNVKLIVENKLSSKNVKLVTSVDYSTMVKLLSNCYLVITDSGGIQEEAPSFGKPVIVTREVTERQEGVEAGVAFLVGHSKEKIIETFVKLLIESEYKKIVNIKNPYGDGKSSEKIIEILKKYEECITNS